MVRSEVVIEQMIYEMDPEITAVVTHVFEQSADLPAIERGDWKRIGRGETSAKNIWIVLYLLLQMCD